MRALVTGGASLVGSHLCDRLLAEGYEVAAVDDLSTGTWANVVHLKREPRFAFIEHDVAQAFTARVDVVYHLAIPSTRARHEADVVKAAMTCVAGTKNVLEVAAENGARVVVATSTSRWGEALRCAEAVARELGRARGVDVRFVRMTSTYGPRMAPDDEHVLTKMVLAALHGDALEAEDESVLRLTWFQDVVETLVRAMGHAVPIPPVAAPYVEATVRQIGNAVAAATGAPQGARHANGPASGNGARAKSLIDAFPASLVFGLGPSVSLVEGVAQTVSWFRAMRRADGGPRARASLARPDALVANRPTTRLCSTDGTPDAPHEDDAEARAARSRAG